MCWVPTTASGAHHPLCPAVSVTALRPVLWRDEDVTSCLTMTSVLFWDLHYNWMPTYPQKEQCRDFCYVPLRLRSSPQPRTSALTRESSYTLWVPLTQVNSWPSTVEHKGDKPFVNYLETVKPQTVLVFQYPSCFDCLSV